jgi:hypothetical protein
MVTKLVTCPDPGHLEEIEYEEHPLGLLIRTCMHFGPRSHVACPRTCARRMDQRLRLAKAPGRELDEPGPRW